MFWNNIKERIESFYAKNKLNRGRVIVAFSGGADSTALLLNLREYLNNDIVALYFAHYIRPEWEQSRELDHIERFCNFYGISFQIKHCSVDIKKEARGLRMSVEELARKYRYDAFLEALRENEAIYVALAHNRGDQFETLVMRFFQGSFLDGLAGIPIVNGSIIRPLLDVSREEIEEFLSLNKIVCSVDSTNGEDLHLRNKIRNKLIPVVDEIFEGYQKSLKRVSEFSIEFVSFFDKSNFLPFSKGNYYYSFDAVVFFELPRYLVFRTIFKILNLEGIVLNVSYGALGEIFKVDFLKKKSVILLRNSYFFLEKRKDRVNLVFRRVEDLYEPFDFILKLNEHYSLSLGKILLECLECEDSSILELRFCSYEFKYRFFKNKLCAKRFFSRFVRYNPLYLMLLVLKSKVVGIINLNTLDLVWSDKSILKKINISLIGGFLEE
ncbi:tRNA lysidine(34) synthetase TilS [Borrelia sp. BU AG58]|uniref:tRNA lysidine(34) synthetase TilS n=1 Tax=Borrelia sp. BU AG58 TaxID=2887345 RepID=UPI001E382CB5|nr:tRNA lysidine(34) synthetase TilS [Borrelia sp. BU AG58]UER67929.1 tRNA lysidine(34) synthetase TilS [Borrelia sp. BU AG58]